MTTNVPAPTFGPTGFVVPTQEAVLAGVIADINAAFGGGLNFDNLETPQGQLASSIAAIIGYADDTFVYYTNQVDPAYAVGRMQDAIARIYFLTRNPPEPTAVQAVCTGLPGTVIPEGSLAQAEDDNIYVSTEAGVIPAGGSITLSFASTVDGPIACVAGTLNRIYQAIPGWDSILNLVDGVLGKFVETRYEFEQRRQATVAANASGALDSVIGAVLKVPDVLDAFAVENVTGGTVVIRGASLVAHSILVSVVGGDADAVARAIWSKKAPGCNYNGNITITVLDDNPAYTPPLPSYDVKFQIPAALPIIFKVTLASNSQVPSNAETLIDNAIIQAFAGADGGPRAGIASTIYASRFYAPVAALGTWVQIVSIQIGSANTPAATFTASIAAAVLTVTAVAVGPVAVGQTVTDVLGAVAPGTTILTQIGGTPGGNGTYSLSVPQTVTSRTMHGAVADRDSVVTNADQVPTINAANIEVILL